MLGGGREISRERSLFYLVVPLFHPGVRTEGLETATKIVALRRSTAENVRATVVVDKHAPAPIGFVGLLEPVKKTTSINKNQQTILVFHDPSSLRVQRERKCRTQHTRAHIRRLQ